MGYAYEHDLGQCKQLAEQRSLMNDETKMAALAGAALGGVVGAVEAEDNTAPGGAIAGALVGGALGAGGGAIKAHGERKDIVMNCMRGRGHRVVG
ncbi:bacteriocin [Roseibium denhamense]|uniref:bacteriocin n=1 Tax=Roseibium denhamense TaxID=76305 RepID=UPI0024B7C61D|nr:bacteriocin [Roseibium denhamense]